MIYKKKYLFKNPVKQNLSHMYALKDILHEFPNACYFPIVVFAGSVELKRIESSVPVLYASELTATIRKIPPLNAFCKQIALFYGSDFVSQLA